MAKEKKKRNNPGDYKKGNKYRFKKGNEFWKARTSHGPNYKFKSPDVLLDACIEYFDWVHSNPLYEAKAFAGGEKVSLPKMRAMTKNGLYLFLGIDRETWNNYSKKPEFKSVSEYVNNVIYTQKIEGVHAGFFNANIVARETGLVDKQASELSAPGGGPVQHQHTGNFYLFEGVDQSYDDTDPSDEPEANYTDSDTDQSS